MVFSFFKKPPEKMPERPAARPKAPTPVAEPVKPAVPPAQAKPVAPVRQSPTPSLTPRPANPQPLAPPPRPAAPQAPRPASVPPAPRPAKPHPVPVAAGEDDFDSEDLQDFVTVSTIMGVDIREGVDPMQADIEQVVVMYANGQDALARSLLEAHIQVYPCPKGRPFWLMLFDLLQLAGDRPAYDRLCVEYAKSCEMSPPAWKQPAPQTPAAAPGTRHLRLKGVLTAETAGPALAELARCAAGKAPVHIDCGQLLGCDDEVAGQLAAYLRTARQRGPAMVMQAVDALKKRLDERLVTGSPEHEASWLLLLELLQRNDSQEHFEERAIDYAITFEVSPPSWEPRPDSEREVSLPEAESVHYLRGELKNERFDALIPVLELQDAPIVDCGELARLDFFSAGQLVNRLAPYRAAGKEVIIRNPNHLVAGLMAVVGVNKQATVILPKA